MDLRLFSLVRTATAITACALLSACLARVPDAPLEPAMALPENWVAEHDSRDLLEWVPEFESAQLSALVAEALENSPDLQAAAARVAIARAQFGITQSAQLPSVQADLNGRRFRRSGVNDSSFVDNPANLFTVRGQLSWELDIWQRLSAASSGALADVQASEYDLQAARLSLAANVAREWFNAAAGAELIALGEATVASFERSLATVEQQYRRGIGAALDVRLARNNLENARADLQQNLRNRMSSVRTLEALLGRYPDEKLSAAALATVDAAPIPAGLPSQILARRPDVRSAERTLRGAKARETQARRNWLPRFTLSTEGGTSSDILRNLTDLDFLIWTIAGTVTQPLFQGGRLKAERAQASARVDEALARYAQVVLTALREVETTLDAEVYLREQEAALGRSVREAEAAETLALRRYERGLSDIVTLLESQRRAFSARSALIGLRNQRLQNRVNLYAALGGSPLAADTAEGIASIP